MPKKATRLYHPGGIVADGIHKPYNIHSIFHRGRNPRLKCCRNTTIMNRAKPNDPDCCYPTIESCFQRSPQEILDDQEDACSKMHNIPNCRCIGERNLAENGKTLAALLSCKPKRCERRQDLACNCCKAYGLDDDDDCDKLLPGSVPTASPLYIPTSCILSHCKCFKPDPRRRKRRGCFFQSCQNPLQQQSCGFYPQTQNQGDCSNFSQSHVVGDSFSHQAQNASETFDNNTASHIKDSLGEDDNTESAMIDLLGEDAPSQPSNLPSRTDAMKDTAGGRGQPTRSKADDQKSQIQHLLNDYIDETSKDCTTKIQDKCNHYKDCNCLMCRRRRGGRYCISPKITDAKSGRYRKLRQDKNNNMQKREAGLGCSCSIGKPGACTACQCQNQNNVNSNSFSQILNNLYNDPTSANTCTGKPNCPCPKCCKQREHCRIKPYHWYSNDLENPMTKFKRSFFNNTDSNNNVPKPKADENSTKKDRHTAKASKHFDTNNNANKLQTGRSENQKYTDYDEQEGEDPSPATPAGNECINTVSCSPTWLGEDNTPNQEQFRNENSCTSENSCRKSFGLGVDSCCPCPCYCTPCANCMCLQPQNWQCDCCNNVQQNNTCCPEQPCQKRHICDRYPRFFNKKCCQTNCSPCNNKGGGGNCSQPCKSEDTCIPAPTPYNTSIYRRSYQNQGCHKPWLRHLPNINPETCDDDERGLFPQKCPPHVFIHPDDEGFSDGRPRYGRGRKNYKHQDTSKIFSELDERRGACLCSPSPFKPCQSPCQQRICNDRDCIMPFHMEFRKQRWPNDLCACCCTTDSSMFARYCSCN